MNQFINKFSGNDIMVARILFESSVGSRIPIEENTNNITVLVNNETINILTKFLSVCYIRNFVDFIQQVF